MAKKTYRIMVVDDEENILDSLSKILEFSDDFKCEVTTSSNGNEALGKLVEKEYDLILADYKMPGMTGVELLGRAKEIWPSTIRILVTGFSDIDIAKEAINKAHVYSYIGKPWDNDELMLTVSEALKRKDQRESEKVTTIDEVKAALKLVNDLRDKVLSEQKLMFSFSSIPEMNKFSFEIAKMKNVQMKDFHIYDNKYMISVMIGPELFDFIP